MRQAEFGDYQTPAQLAREVCELVRRLDFAPQTIVEPTCGVGNFAIASARCFPQAKLLFAADLQADYVRETAARFESVGCSSEVRIEQRDFFATEWDALLADVPDPILVIGNPPWVNNSALGALQSGNHPEKRNADRLRGIEAITGKSNFDISEWMMRRLLEAIRGRRAMLAMLCKTRVARKTLAWAWRHDIDLHEASLYRIDARRAFGAAVDACLLVCCLGRRHAEANCAVYTDLHSDRAAERFGYRDRRWVSNLEAYDRWQHLCGAFGARWRSGIKHDCAPVMELRRADAGWQNGLGEIVELEDEYLYPLVKSSQLDRGATDPDRWLLVPQRSVGEDTAGIARRAPKTWRYLQRHADRLDRRASSIYRNRPRFSVFGVGAYSFARWKVAVSGFHKTPRFRALGPCSRKPIVSDDTCYSVPCQDEASARELCDWLNHPIAQAFYSAFVFPGAKRPVTVELLQSLDLAALQSEIRVTGS